VRLIGHHAGITLGFYGTSHHATEDMAIMRAIAGITVIAPADAGMLAKAIRCSMEWPEPIYFRIGRGREPDVYDESALVDYQIGKAIVHRLGTEATIIATGSTVAQSIQAVETLAKEGHDIGIVDMHTIKPLDTDAICQAAAACPLLITVEEHNVIGGLGGAVAETVTTLGLNVRVHRHGIPDTYSLIGPPTHLYQHYKLDADGIVDTVIALIEGR
jgi:transketolase